MNQVKQNQSVSKNLDVNVWFTGKKIKRLELCDGTPLHIAPLEEACVVVRHGFHDGNNRVTGGAFRYFLWVHSDLSVTWSRTPRTEQTAKRTIAMLRRECGIKENPFQACLALAREEDWGARLSTDDSLFGTVMARIAWEQFNIEPPKGVRIYTDQYTNSTPLPKANAAYGRKIRATEVNRG